MKKIITLITLIAAAQSINGCQVVITNTTRDAVVTVLDERSGKSVQAKEGQAVKGNTDPDQHARLVVTVTHDKHPKRTYKVTQFACSKSHEIPVTTTQIIHGFKDTKFADDMDVDQLCKIEKTAS